MLNICFSYGELFDLPFMHTINKLEIIVFVLSCIV